MKDPLRIFTKEQLDSLNDYNLRRLKKEFFIPFRFGGKTSVILNNNEIDQPTLEAIFEELEVNLPEYLITHKNTVLTDFFSNGDTGFLFNDQQYNEVNELIKTNPKLEERIAYKLNDVIANICQNLTTNSNYVLQSLLVFTSEFSRENQKIAYSKSYEELEQFITRLESIQSNPFNHNSGTEYKSDIGLMVNLQKASTLSYLPKSFETLDKKYSHWCNSVIVKKSLDRQTVLHKYKKRDLKIFKEAMNIANRHFSTEELQSNIITAKKKLKGGGSIKNGWSCLTVILGTIAVIRLIIGIANYSNSNSSNRGSNRQHDEEVANFLEEMQRLRKEKQYSDALKEKQADSKEKTSTTKEKESQTHDNKDTKKSSKYAVIQKAPEQNQSEKNTLDFKGKFSKIQLCKNYSGEQWEQLKAKQKKFKVKGDTIFVEYNTELLPTSESEFSKLLPPIVHTEGPGKYSVASLSFSNRDMNIKASHLMDIIYNIDDNPPSTFYTRKIPDTGTKLSLSAKRIPFGDYNVKGEILLKDTKSGQTKEKTKFNIKFDRVNKVYQITYGNNKSIKLTTAQTKKTSLIDRKRILDKKFATIISNLNQLHNKYLKEKNWYSIKNIAEYSLIVDAKIKNSAAKFETNKGNFRYSFSSSIDNLAYCELNTKNTAFKYIFDQKSGIVKGMIRATVSYTKNEVEQVIIFKKNYKQQ